MKGIVIFGIAGAVVGSAYACCGLYAGHFQANKKIEFTGQSNIVIWDERNQMEHFIRAARFKSAAKEFDFVAPTPSVPEVSVAKQAAFEYVRSLTTPPPPVTKSGGFGNAGGRPGNPPGTVYVAQETEVGNFHVVTLKATDTQALKKWFEENQYQVSPTQDEWFKHYIDKKWYLTAFRVISDKPAVKTEAIRMSFSTKVPYNPYFVPKENWYRGAQLELFLIAPYAMQGVVGESFWRGSMQGKATLPHDKYTEFAKNLGMQPGEIPSNMTVYRYLDYDFANGATEDLFFYPKKQK